VGNETPDYPTIPEERDTATEETPPEPLAPKKKGRKRNGASLWGLGNQDVNLNQEGATHLSQTSRFLRRIWHIEHWYHYIRQQVQNDQLTIRTLPGKDNSVDILTKPTPISTISAWKTLWLAKTGEAGSIS